MTKVLSRFSIGAMSTNANVQEHWGGISAMLDALGLAKTADTGQMVIGSLTGPPTGNTYPVYEVRTWNDGYGALFMKWEYGVGTAVSTPRYRITIGTGSDGSGNITGVIYSQLTAGDLSATTASANQHPQYAGRSGASWWIALTNQSQSTTQPTFVFAFDRRRDASGAVVVGADAGYWVLYRNSIGTSTWTCISVRVKDFWASSSNSQLHTFAPNYTNTPYSGLALAAQGLDVFALFGSYPDPCVIPCGVAYWVNEVSTFASMVIDATVGGVVRRYLSITQGSPVTPGYIGNTVQGLALVWED